MKSLRILALLAPLIAFTTPPTRLDFKDAHITEDYIETNEGGLLENLDFWVQGKYIRYFRSAGKSLVHAAGQLRIEYQGMLFIGDRIEYDLKSRSGVLYEGKTQSGSFYISGKKIIFSQMDSAGLKVQCSPPVKIKTLLGT